MRIPEGVVPIKPGSRTLTTLSRLPRTGRASCVACHLELPRAGLGRPDPCFRGCIPDVTHACCGHGLTRDVYVVVAPGYEPHTPSYDIAEEDRLTFYGDEARLILDYLLAEQSG